MAFSEDPPDDEQSGGPNLRAFMLACGAHILSESTAHPHDPGSAVAGQTIMRINGFTGDA